MIDQGVYREGKDGLNMGEVKVNRYNQIDEEG